VFCLWLFVPMKIAPSEAFSFILWFDIILQCCLFPIGSGYMYNNGGHKTMYGYGMLFWLMSFFNIYVMIINCKWKQWLKSGTLSCHSKTWFGIRSFFWAFICCISVYGFCYHYHLWDQAQKDYNKFSKKSDDMVFMSDAARGIGSYSESVTREIFYSLSMFLSTFLSVYAFA